MSLTINGLNSSASSGGTTVTIGEGSARDSTDSVTITVPAGQTRTIDLSVNGPGGLDTGTVAANAVYAIYIGDTTPTKGVASVSFTAPSGIGSTKFRRIGSIATNGSAKVIAFTQTGSSNARTVSFSSDPAARKVVNGGSAAIWTAFQADPPGSDNMTSASLHVEPSAGGTTMVQASDGTGTTTIASPTTLSLTMPGGSTWGNFKTPSGTTTIRVDGFDENV